MLLTLLAASVVINEIAWMGTDISFNDEWIELYNITDDAVNLDGWMLKAEDGIPEIALSGTISGKGFYLLEKSDDESVPGISADLIYKGALGNNGENLKLFDNFGNLVDEIDCTDGWVAGDNETKLTMEKTDIGWQTSRESGGTPKALNWQPNQQLQKKVENRTLPSYPEGIIFSRILPSPKGPDAENEWIEIYNTNDFEVDLSEWQIRDTAGRITAYTLNTKIKELSSLILPRPETKIILNNSGDGLELINPNGEVIDSMEFEKAPQGQIYIKSSSGWQWENEKEKIKKLQSLSTKKLLQEKAEENKKTMGQIIDLSQKKNLKIPVVLIALIISLISAGAVISVKNLLS